MSRFRVAIAAFVAAIMNDYAMVSGSLRDSGDDQPSLDLVLLKLEELQHEIIRLRTRVDSLEKELSELKHHRQMTDQHCGFTYINDVCQFVSPMELFDDLVVQGANTVFTGDVEIGGNVVLRGNTTIFCNDVSISGATRLNDLIVGTSLEVFGDSSFGSNVVGAQRNAKPGTGSEILSLITRQTLMARQSLVIVSVSLERTLDSKWMAYPNLAKT